MNLLNIIQNQIDGNLLNQISKIIGSNNDSTRNAITAFVPTLLSGIIGKGNTLSGASSLISIITNNKFGEQSLSNFASVLTDEEKTTDLIKTGEGISSSLFENKQVGLVSRLASVSGLNKSSSSKLMSLLGPIAMGSIGKIVNRDSLDAAGLQRLLGRQKNNVMSAVPASISSYLGYDAVKTRTDNVTQNNVKHTSYKEENTKGFAWWKILLPIAAIAAILWFLTQYNGDKKPVVKKTAANKEAMVKKRMTAKEQKLAGSKETSEHSTSSPSTQSTASSGGSIKYSLDSKGNLIDAAGSLIATAGSFSISGGNLIDGAGKILARAGEFTGQLSNDTMKKELSFSLDASGNLIGADGKIAFKKGEFTEKDGVFYDLKGNRIGNFLKKVGEAIEGAATKTKEAFQDMFSSMLNKEAKSENIYTFSRIDFKEDDHRISYFSKPELEGLAAALKAIPNGKMEVQVYTDSGKNDAENKSLSKLRAKVVHDMLVTLGVKDGQISFKGMGNSDPAKAASGKVDIKVE